MSIVEGLRRLLGEGKRPLVEDPVFSALRRVRARAPACDYWEGNAQLGSSGQVEVFVDVGGATPSEEQREFFRTLDRSIEDQCTEVLARARETRGFDVSGTPRPVWVAIPVHPSSEQVEIGFEVGRGGAGGIVGQYARGRLVAVKVES